MYLRARYYDSQTGEFISRDPLEYVDGLSMYRAYFVPFTVDPLGLLVKLGFNNWLTVGEIDGKTIIYTGEFCFYYQWEPGIGTFKVKVPCPNKNSQQCEIAVRCIDTGWGDISFGGHRHCGLVVRMKDWGTFGLDGSGGDTNIINWTDPKNAGTVGPFKKFPMSICSCLLQHTAYWNNLRIPRDHVNNNSNWTLKCMSKACRFKIEWDGSGIMSKPIGFDSDWWEWVPNEGGLGGRNQTCGRECPESFNQSLLDYEDHWGTGQGHTLPVR